MPWRGPVAGARTRASDGGGWGGGPSRLSRWQRGLDHSMRPAKVGLVGRVGVIRGAGGSRNQLLPIGDSSSAGQGPLQDDKGRVAGITCRRGGGVRGQKNGCVPKTDVQFRAPMSFLSRGNNFSDVGGGWVRRRSPGCHSAPPPPQIPRPCANPPPPPSVTVPNGLTQCYGVIFEVAGAGGRSGAAVVRTDANACPLPAHTPRWSSRRRGP